MNVYDSQRIADVVRNQGFIEADRIDDAELVVLNTCHIRERASEKVFSELGRVRALKQARAAEGLDMIIVIAGCVAQAEGREILRRQPAVDLVVGPQSYQHLPDLLARARPRKIVDTNFPIEAKFDHLPAAAPEATRARGVSAFVTIQEGCNKFCSFCVVPYTRGAEYSRPVVKVLEEISRLSEAGAREFTLLGQNVNAYHGLDERGQSVNLAALLERAANLPGVARLRYTTSHPLDMDAALIRAHAENEKLAPFLHLPVQSGSDRVLQNMNRRHTVNDYLKVIESLRKVRPDIALSSDFIVGFPGETHADFEATLALARSVRFASSFAFKYSARPGTPASESNDQVPETIKAERLAALLGQLDSDRHAFDRETVGRRFNVIFDRSGRHAGQLVGKSPYMQAVAAQADASLIGQMTSVEIIDTKSNSLVGEVCAMAS